MATATATFTQYVYPNGLDETGRFERHIGTVAIQASPATYATGGLALSFLNESVKSNNPAQQVSIYSVAGSGYVYAYNASTGKVQIFQSAGSAAPLAELGNGSAIPAGVSGDTIEAQASFFRD